LLFRIKFEGCLSTAAITFDGLLKKNAILSEAALFILSLNMYEYIVAKKYLRHYFYQTMLTKDLESVE